MSNKLMVAGVAIAALVTTAAALAGSLRCGGYLIEDGGLNPPGKYEVLKMCGPPIAKFGNDWIYEQDGAKRVVHFNDSGQVESISDD